MSTPKEDEMAGSVIALLLTIPIMFLRAAVTQQVWIWYLPWPVPGLKPIIAVGTALQLYVTRHQVPDATPLISILGSVLVNLAVLFIAWVLH